MTPENLSVVSAIVRIMNSGEIERAYAAAEQAIAALADLPTHRMTATELLDSRARHERLARLVAAADREPLARLMERGTDDFGGGALKAILADRLRITRTEAGRRLHEAADLASRTTASGERLPPLLPRVAEAEARGAIGSGHVHVIRTFMHHLPDAVDVHTRRNAERDLVGYAEYLRPDQVEKCAEHLALLVNPDGEFSDRDRARKRSFTMQPQGPDKMRSADSAPTRSLPPIWRRSSRSSPRRACATRTMCDRWSTVSRTGRPPPGTGAPPVNVATMRCPPSAGMRWRPGGWGPTVDCRSR